jgi:hypothetical protein
VQVGRLSGDGVTDEHVGDGDGVCLILGVHGFDLLLGKWGLVEPRAAEASRSPQGVLLVFTSGVRRAQQRLDGGAGEAPASTDLGPLQGSVPQPAVEGGGGDPEDVLDLCGVEVGFGR